MQLALILSWRFQTLYPPVHIDVVDLSAVLTTFLDNALLRAHGQENSLVRMSYYQRGEVQVLSVETTLSQDSAEAPHEA